jgi:hypothetical protein
MEPTPLMLIALFGAHFYFDYAGQGDFMAKAKNCSAPLPGVPWTDVLFAHSCIHGAAAALITGLWPVFFAEALVHYVTDWQKCRGRLTFTQDQGIHVLCKVGWFVAACLV